MDRSVTAWVVTCAALFALALATPMAQAAFPGENGKIAFTCGGEFGGVCTINPDGSDYHALPTREPGSEVSVGAGAWSPDGTRLLFSQQGDPWVMAPDGSNKTPVPLGGRWSPDGSQLVFSREQGFGDARETRVFTADLDGGNLSPVTSGPHDRTPRWSPTGKIAFLRDASGSFHDVNIYTVRPDGTELTKITQLLYVHTNFDWSPDGSRLVFATRDGDSTACDVQPPPVGCERGIWTVNQDGSGLRKLVGGDTNAAPIDPAFSPDGTKIVFTIAYQFPETGRFAGNGLYTMNVDGSAIKELAPIERLNFNRMRGADWQPLPFKNASAKCKAFPGQYRNHGQCVKASR